MYSFNSINLKKTFSFDTIEAYAQWFLNLSSDLRFVVEKDISGIILKSWISLVDLDDAYDGLPSKHYAPIPLTTSQRVKKEKNGCSFFGDGDMTNLVNQPLSIMTKKSSRHYELEYVGSSFIHRVKRVPNVLIRRRFWFAKNRFMERKKEIKRKHDGQKSVKIGDHKVRLPLKNRFFGLKNEEYRPVYTEKKYKFKKQKKNKKEKKTFEEVYFDRVYKSKPLRSIMLLYKLKKIIFDLRQKRCKSSEILPGLIRRESKLRSQLFVRPSITMVAEHQADIKSTAIESEVDVDKTLTTEVIDQGGVDAVVSDSDHGQEILQPRRIESFETLVDKWIQVQSFKWDSTQIPGTALVKLSLPGALFENQSIRNTTMVTTFRNYRYHTFDMEVKIQINSSTMHQGCLIAYHRYLDNLTIGNTGQFDNHCIGCQAPHVFVRAGENNSGHLVIPFKFFYPKLSMTNKFEIESITRLIIQVFNTLRARPGVAVSVWGNLLVKFTNLNPSGQVFNLQLTCAEHQMMRRMAIGFVENLLDQVLPDTNRDNPTNPTPSQSFVPRSSHSWCQGTGISEIVEVLRLNPRGTTPHFSRKDEMKVSHLVRKFGWLDTISWKSKDAVGYELFNHVIHPRMCEKNKLTSGDSTNNRLPHYSSSPVGVVTSMFAYWRGSIEFRMDFIAPFSTTGRIFCAFVPCFMLGAEEFTFEQAKTCFGTYFDLGQTKSFTFVVPYEFPRNWSYGTVINGSSPGTFHIFVVNPLNYFDGTPDICEINIFVRGGEDFEVAVPIVPHVFPAYNDTYISMDYFHAGGYVNPGSSDLYLVTEEIDGKFVPTKCATIKGAISDLWFEPVEPMRYDSVYEFVPSKKFKRIEIYNNDQKKIEMKYAVPVARKKDKKCTECVWFNNLSDAKRLAALQSDPAFRYNYEDNINKVKPLIMTSYGFPSAEHPDTVYLKRISVTENEHQVDDRAMTGIKSAPGRLVKYISRIFFNESFCDLKDLCRRYQIYGEVAVKIPANECFGNVFLRIPIQPGGLNHAINPEKGECILQFLNQIRDGVIPLLASGYRFFRGSLRFKFVFSNDPVTLAITHVPNRYYHKGIKKVTSKGYISCNPQGYATYIQNLAINNIVEIEVPYYSHADYISSQIVDRSYHASTQSLGYFDVSVVSQSRVEREIGLQIYYAFGDDARFSSFMGFPSVIPIEDVPQPIPPPPKEVRQEDEKEDREFFMVAEHQMDYVRRATKAITRPIVDGIFDASTERIGEATTSTAPLVDKVKTWSEKKWEDTSTQILSFIEQLKGMFGSIISNMGATIYNIMIHIMNFITSSKTHFVIRLAYMFFSIAVTIGLIRFEDLSNIMKYVGRCTFGISAVECVSDIIKRKKNDKLDHWLTKGHLISDAMQYKDGEYVKFRERFAHMFPPDRSGHERMKLVWFHSRKIIKALQIGEAEIKIQAEKAASKDLFNTMDTIDDLSAIDITDNISTAEHQADFSSDKDLAALSSTILTSVAATVGLSLGSRETPNFFSNFMRDIRSFTSTSNSLFTMIQNNLNCLKDAYQWCLMQLHGLDVSIDLANEPENLREFLYEATKLTNDKSLYTRITQEPGLQRRVFTLSFNANRLLSSGMHFGQSIFVRDTLQKLINLQDRLIDDCLCPNVGYEPFVLYLYGKPKVGKSSLYTQLAIDAMEAIDYKTHSELLYVRTAGNQYWNGIGLQPNIVYDDFATDRESFPSQITELFQLKSPCSFNPPTAHLDDKKRRINPLQVIICSNTDTFEDGMGFIYSPEAVARRRDALWEVDFVSHIGNREVSISDCLREREAYFNEHNRPTFKHLRFRKCKNPQKLTNLNRYTQYGDWMDYASFRSNYISDFMRYRQVELKRYKWRYDLLTRYMPDETTLLTDQQINDSIDLALDKHYDQFHESTPSFLSEIKKVCDPGRAQVMGLDERFVRSDPMTVLNVLRSTVEPQAVAEHQSDHQMKIFKGKGKKKKELPIHQMETAPLLGKQEYDDISLDGDDKQAVKSAMTVLNVTPGPSGLQPAVSEVTEAQLAICCHWKLKNVKPELYNGRRFVDEENNPITNLMTKKEFKDDQFYFFLRDDYMKEEHHVGEKCLAKDDDKISNLCFFNTDEGKNWFKSWLVLNRSISCTYAWFEFPNTLMEKGWKSKWRINNYAMTFDDDDAVTPAQRHEIEGFFSKFKKRLFAFWEKIKDNKILGYVKNIGKIIGVMALFFGGYKLYQHVTAPSPDPLPTPIVTTTTVDPWGDHQAAYKPDVKGVTRSKFSNVKAKTVAATASHNSTSTSNELENIVSSNLAWFRLVVDGVRVGSLKGLGISFRTYLIGAHFFEEFEGLKKQNRKVQIEYCKDSTRILLNSKDIEVTYYENSSLAIATFSNRIPSVRNIRKHFAKQKDFSYLPSKSVLFELTEGNHFVCHPVNARLKRGLKINARGNMKEVFIPEAFTYEGHSKLGMCGSVLMSSAPPYRIYGLHVAGNPEGSGFAEPVTFEDLDFSEHQSEMAWVDLDYDKVEKSKIPIPENLNVIGTLPPPLEPSTSITTQRVPTLMFDAVFKHQSIPAPLSSRDYDLAEKGIDPFNKSMLKYSNIPEPFDRDLVRECSKELSEQLIYTSKPVLSSRKIVLPDQDVVCGIPGVEGYNPMNMASSEGFPLCLMRKIGKEGLDQLHHFKKESYSGKEWLFDYDIINEGKKLKTIHPNLLNIHNKHMDLRKKGIVPQSFFICTLKDACIETSKALSGKNRIFSNSPVELTMATKKYFGHFQAAYQQGRIKNGTAIGINCNSFEWTVLANKLLEKGDNIITGDYSGFGDTLDRVVMEGAFKAIEDWYEYYYGDELDYEESRRIRRSLFEEICSAPQIARNLVFVRNCGIPSGFGLTVEINDLVNKLYMLYAWKIITKESFSRFKQHVYFCCYGDDIIMSVSSDYIKIFNFETIKKFLADYNIQFTSAEKDGSSYLSRSLFESTFMKGSFKLHPRRNGIFLYDLPLSSCLDMLNWQWKNNDQVTVCYEASRASLMSLFGKGKEIHDEYRKKIYSWFVERSGTAEFPSGEIPHLMTWEEIDNKVFGNL